MDCNLNNNVFARPVWATAPTVEAQLEWERDLAAGKRTRPTSTTQASTASLKCSQCKRDTTIIYHTASGDLCLECYTKMREKQDSYYCYTVPTLLEKAVAALERIAYTLETEFEIDTEPVTTCSSTTYSSVPSTSPDPDISKQWVSFSDMLSEHLGGDNMKSAPNTACRNINTYDPTASDGYQQLFDALTNKKKPN